MNWHKLQFQNLLNTENLTAIVVFANNFDDRFLKAIAGISSILQSYLIITKSKTILIEPLYLFAERKLRLKPAGIIFHPAAGESLIGTEVKKLIKPGQRIGICGACKFIDIKSLRAKKVIDLTDQADLIISHKTDKFIGQISSLAKKLSQILSELKIVGNTNQLTIVNKINQKVAQLNCQFSFPLCITSGKDLNQNTCLNPKNKIIKLKEMVCVDMGLKQNGLITDMTRMFFVDHPQAKKLHDLIFREHLKIILKITPDLTFPQLINQYEKIKISGIKMSREDFGHGLGFAEHEPPTLEKSKVKIGKNTIFTIEPTFKTKFGLMRFEDMIAIDSHGEVRNLTEKCL